MAKRMIFKLIAVIAVFMMAHLLSCKQATKSTAKEQAKPDSPKRIIQPQHQPSGNDDDSVLTYTDAVYNTYVPPAVRALLQEKLPGWKLPSPNRWEKFWFDAYKKERSLVNYASGEFNGDGKPDYTLLLENEQGAFIIWVLQSGADDYKPIELTELTEATLPLNVGLELIDKGKLNYLDMGNGVDDVKSLKLKHQAIQVSFFESAADTYYWKDGKFVSVTTGD